jgi:hypothetical protein
VRGLARRWLDEPELVGCILDGFRKAGLEIPPATHSERVSH